MAEARREQAYRSPRRDALNGGRPMLDRRPRHEELSHSARRAADSHRHLAVARARRGDRDHGAIGQRQEHAALHPRRARTAVVRDGDARRRRIPSGWASASRRRSATAKSASSSRTTRCCRSARCSRTCWRRRSWRRRPRMAPTRPPRARTRCSRRSGSAIVSIIVRRALRWRKAARRACARAHPQSGAAAVRRAHRQPRSRRRRHGRRSAA